MKNSIPHGALLAVLAAPLAWSQDLGGVYASTLEYVSDEDERPVYDWQTGPEHVWKLRSFHFEIEDKLEVKLAACDLVIGHHEENALWAVLVPSRSAKIESSIGGDGEKIQDVYLRFHPSRVGELFPEKTVRGQGDPAALYRAYRLYPWKATGPWTRFGRPVIPPKDELVIDIDTEDGKRRVYTVDLDRGRAKHRSGYLTDAAPRMNSCKRKESVALVDAAWEALDTEYALFDRTPGLDWSACLEDARKVAGKCRTDFDAAVAVRELFNRLEDEDLWVRYGPVLVTDHQLEREFNASWTGLRHILGNVEVVDKSYFGWARTPHDVGYINVLRFGGEEHDAEMVEAFDEALEKLATSWALILDLRFADIGNRETAQAIAGRFLGADHTYGFVQHRTEEGHGAFTEPEPLVCAPRGPWTYGAPVYLLLGPGTERDGEELASMILGGERIITAGSPTAGRSSSVKWREVTDGLRIAFTTERLLDADGQPVAQVPMVPELAIEFDEEEFDAENDPVLYRLLEEVLKTPYEERQPANPDAVDEEPADGEAGEDEADEEGADSEA